MAEFCKCGSLIINDKCSNKNCAFKVDKVPGGAAKKTAAAKSSAEKKSKTATGARRSSKCITYSIDELPDRDPKYKEDLEDADEDSEEESDSGYDSDYDRYEKEEEV